MDGKERDAHQLSWSSHFVGLPSTAVVKPCPVPDHRIDTLISPHRSFCHRFLLSLDTDDNTSTTDPSIMPLRCIMQWHNVWHCERIVQI